MQSTMLKQCIKVGRTSAAWLPREAHVVRLYPPTGAAGRFHPLSNQPAARPGCRADLRHRDPPVGRAEKPPVRRPQIPRRGAWDTRPSNFDAVRIFGRTALHRELRGDIAVPAWIVPDYTDGSALAGASNFGGFWTFDTHPCDSEEVQCVLGEYLSLRGAVNGGQAGLRRAVGRAYLFSIIALADSRCRGRGRWDGVSAVRDADAEPRDSRHVEDRIRFILRSPDRVRSPAHGCMGASTEPDGTNAAKRILVGSHGVKQRKCVCRIECVGIDEIERHRLR
ncbi:hypothetical protein B0H13DRAFT_1893340 [Mycena leptocephala]|nr:hypothetical protein B0H13DRAFT_1893340 [Mycena leptocephala]